MRVLFLWPVIAAGAVCAVSQNVLGESETNLHRLADQYWDARMERYPTAATAQGDYRFNDRLEDLSLEGEKRWQNRLERFLAGVEAFSTDNLSAEDRLTHDLFKRTIRDELLLLECDLSLTSLDPLDGPHLKFPLILVSQPFRNEQDFENYVQRLKAFPKQVDEMIATMRVGLADRIISPKVLVEKVLPQLRTHIVENVEQSEFYKPVRTMDSIDESKRQSLTDEIAKAITNEVVPAYEKLLRFAEQEYLSHCRSTVGIGERPGGLEAYEKLIYINTTVKLKPDDIHQLGLSEVARIRREMSKIKDEVGFKGSLDEFLTHMRTDPKYRFQSGEELYAAADRILQRAKSQMPKLFRRLPKADCVMKEIEAFRAPSSPVAYYNPTPEDGSRPGYYYINTYAPQERLRFTLEALSYHEAVPGHHFQMALHQEDKDLPKFRRYGSFTAYVEGWALYTEKLGYEIGGYQTPEDRFGQLTFEMWRACRLVVDTGMHAKGWTRQQAIDFMTSNTSLAPLDIESEIDRYISWAGQALAYKIGELRILDLRKLAEEKLGSRFDLRAFNDRLLADGPMPIDMLEARVRAWIAEQASKN